MKPVFRFLFNAARSISLVLVLVVAGYTAVLYFSGDLQRQVKRMERFEQMEQAGLLEADAVEDFEALQSDKVGLKAGRTKHFIRPEKTAFFYASQGKVYAVTLQRDTIGPLSSPLRGIAESLAEREHDYFFHTREHLFNYHHITHYYSENIARPGSTPNYKYWIVMDTGHVLPMPKERYQDFRNKMEFYAVPIE